MSEFASAVPRACEPPSTIAATPSIGKTRPNSPQQTSLAAACRELISWRTAHDHDLISAANYILPPRQITLPTKIRSTSVASSSSEIPEPLTTKPRLSPT